MGPQTELLITFSAAFCTSGSGNASPSARPSKILKNTANTAMNYSYVKIHVQGVKCSQQATEMETVQVNVNKTKYKATHEPNCWYWISIRLPDLLT